MYSELWSGTITVSGFFLLFFTRIAIVVANAATTRTITKIKAKPKKDDELSWELTEPIRFNIYDRIGGGDAYASGVIHGLLLNFNDPAYAVRYGLNTSVLKHTIYGDVSTLRCEDIESFMKELGNSFSFIGSEYKIKIGEI